MSATPGTIPVCPILSIGSAEAQLCYGEQCGWYVPAVKKCALMILGHQAALEVHNTQQN